MAKTTILTASIFHKNICDKKLIYKYMYNANFYYVYEGFMKESNYITIKLKNCSYPDKRRFPMKKKLS